MQGEGSVWAQETHPYRPSKQIDEDRWQMERFIFATCVKNARRQGTKIYRYPTPIPHTQAA
jgi:hypothetical protein